MKTITPGSPYVHTHACWYTDDQVRPKPTRLSVGGTTNEGKEILGLVCLYREHGIVSELRLTEDELGELILRLADVYEVQVEEREKREATAGAAPGRKTRGKQ